VAAGALGPPSVIGGPVAPILEMDYNDGKWANVSPLRRLRMYGIGTTELIIVFGIVLLLFGGTKLPGVGRALGGAISEFKASVKGGTKDEEEEKPPEGENKTA